MQRVVLLGLAYIGLAVYGVSRALPVVVSWTLDLLEDMAMIVWCAFNVRPFRTPMRTAAIIWLLWSIITIDG